MKQYLCSALLGKKVLILGFGREGQSTLRLLREIMPVEGITISDQNETLVQTHPSIIECNLQTKSGIDYLSGLNDFDVIIKSPGIQLDPDKVSFDPFKITSQTDLFLSVYSKQIVGITGTKGKSTTCSLLYHIINAYSGDALLGGNIGIPLFELIDDIAPGTKIICELSSHQLEYIHTAPHISVLLNLYQEHLDHYKSFYHYQKAKFNIATAQKAGDYFIYAVSDKNIKMLLDEIPVPGIPLPFYDDKLTGNGIGISNDEIILQCENLTKNILPFNFKTNLVGNHNRNNAIIASAVAVLLDVPSEAIEKALITFNPLEHRIEFVGNINGVRYYNDSISTIPEAAIAAVESLKPIDTLILGGFDRGIDYLPLVQYLDKTAIQNVVLTGPAGYHLFELINDSCAATDLYYFESFDQSVEKAISITPKGGICLLSPAASSYNEFKNFEERGKRFKMLVQQS